MDLTTATTILAAALRDQSPHLSTSDQSFGADLLHKAGKYGASPRQAEWIIKLAQRSQGTTSPAGVAVEGDVAGIFTLFATARAAGIKYPKVRLTAPDGTPVVLAMAGAKSKYTGQVMLTDGAPFGSNRYFGRISPEGMLVAGRDMTPAVQELLRRFATAPAKVAAAYGKRTGSCCFCARHLETAESVSVGYGPICAGNFGLPWGEVDPAIREPVTVVLNPQQDGAQDDGLPF